MASVTGSVKPRPRAPAPARTRTIASGPYATDAIASSDSAARPVTAVSRCRSPVSGGSSPPGTASGSVVRTDMGAGSSSVRPRAGTRAREGTQRLPAPPPPPTSPVAFFALDLAVLTGR